MALDRFRRHKASPDYTYMMLAGILILFGLVMIASSSVVVSVESFGNNYGFVIKQSVALVLGLIAAIITSRIPYPSWKRLAVPFFVTSLILLVVVFIPGVGKHAKGAARWIDLGPFQLQPSELVKLSFILYLGTWIENRGPKIQRLDHGFLPFGLLLVPLVLILMAQRDLGTLLVILVTAGLMYFVSGASYSHVGLGLAAGVGMLVLLILIAPYRMQRLTTFLNPEADKLGAGYHINQASLAIGSGGIWGRGFGQSLQKYLYLPEPHTDSIFAITVEELGFIRALLVLAVIGLLAYRGYTIASHAPDVFSRTVAFGITTSLLAQALINIGAIMGLIPLTGVPLPFISYGGTSLIASLAGLGIVVGISRFAKGANA